MSDLKRCPFCNAVPEVVEDNGSFLVECPGCRGAAGRAPYREKAIKFWNRRAEGETQGPAVPPGIAHSIACALMGQGALDQRCAQEDAEGIIAEVVDAYNQAPPGEPKTGPQPGAKEIIHARLAAMYGSATSIGAQSVLTLLQDAGYIHREPVGEPKTGDPARERSILVEKLRVERQLQAHLRKFMGEKAWNKALDTYPQPYPEAPKAPTGAREVDPEAAWKALREVLGTDGWTVGDSATYRGFFMWGWDARGKTLRPAPRGTGEAGAWTEEKPNAEGWYWYRQSPGNPKEPLHLETAYGKLCFWHVIHECHEDLPSGEWAGPIPEPGALPMEERDHG